MANRNTIEITFAGDASSLDRAFGKVGGGATQMAAKVEESGARTRKSFDDVAGGIDDSEQKFRGFADTINGTGDIMQGFRDGNIAAVAMGFADLAGGITDFVVPALKSLGARIGTMIGLTTAQTTATSGAAAAQTGLNAALLANPIGLVVAAIAALVAIGFVVIKNWDTIKSAFSATWGWIKDRFGDLVGFVGDLPSKIANVASGMFDGIKNAFRSALNWVIDRWNGLEFRLPEVGFGPFKTPGFTLGVPDIPKFHTGGRVGQGMTPGTEVPAMLLAGERVLGPGRSGGATSSIVINVQGNVLDGRQLGNLVADALNRRAGVSGRLATVR